MSLTENVHLTSFFTAKSKSKVLDFMVSRFPWIQMIFESPISYGTTFNVIYSKKLFSMKDLHRYITDTPNNIINQVLESSYLSRTQNIKVWKTDMKYLDGLEHLTSDFLNNKYFMDTLKMAKTLGRKINCRWKEKRLKEEHDKWAREITRIILDCELEYDLNIRPIYKAFAEFSGYQLLKTNKDMLCEGMIQNHCVGTYINKVNSGECAIFHVEGYTLQVKVMTLDWEGDKQKVREEKINDWTLRSMSYRPEYYSIYDSSRKKVLDNVQFRGKHNEDAPKELVNKVEQMMIAFVKADGFEKVEEGESYQPKTIKEKYDVFENMGGF